MLSKKMYEFLNEKIVINKKAIPPYEELIGYYAEMKDIIENPEILENNDEDILNIAELYSLYYGIMSLTITPKPETEDSKFKLRALYGSIFSTIANSVTAVIYLAQKGLDFQANVIMRQLFELCMILLNVGIDNNKAEILMNTEMTEEKLKLWRKYFSPKELNKTIEEYEGNILSEWRKNAYSSYSNYAHNEFLSFLLCSYSRPTTEDEMLMPNVWGGYVSRVNGILQDMLWLLWYTTKAFMKIISDPKTNISKEDLMDEIDLWNFAIYLFALLDKYYMFYRGIDIEQINIVKKEINNESQTMQKNKT